MRPNFSHVHIQTAKDQRAYGEESAEDYRFWTFQIVWAQSAYEHKSWHPILCGTTSPSRWERGGGTNKDIVEGSKADPCFGGKAALHGRHAPRQIRLYLRYLELRGDHVHNAMCLVALNSGGGRKKLCKMATIEIKNLKADCACWWSIRQYVFDRALFLPFCEDTWKLVGCEIWRKASPRWPIQSCPCSNKIFDQGGYPPFYGKTDQEVLSKVRKGAFAMMVRVAVTMRTGGMVMVLTVIITRSNNDFDDVG